MREVMEPFDEEDDDETDPVAELVPPEPPFQPQLATFEAFPVECFPDAVRDYVIQQSCNLDCDQAAVALPVLAVLASSIGGTRRIRLKRSWTEPSVLWTAVVATGEECSSPPIDAAVGPLENRGRGAGGGGQELGVSGSECIPVPSVPSVPSVPFLPGTDEVSAAVRSRTAPTVASYVTRDWDMPSLIRRLTELPRGLIVCCDELDGWLGRPNACGSRRVSDVSHWLELHGGRSLTGVRQSGGRGSRRAATSNGSPMFDPGSAGASPSQIVAKVNHWPFLTGKQQTLDLPQASVSLTGTIQPETLGQSKTRKYPTGEAARVAMDRLAATGIAVWVNLAKPGGPPRRAISLGRSDYDAAGMREK